MESKFCKGCNTDKPKDKFYVDKTNKIDGLRVKCKACMKLQGQQYRKDNWEDRLKYQRGYRSHNKDRLNSKRRSKYASGESTEKAYQSTRRKENPEYIKNYKKENHARVNTLNRERRQERYRTDPIYNLKTGLKAQLRMCLRNDHVYKTKSRLYPIVGLTGRELINHLHSTFELNYGLPRECINLADVEIDHIIPLSTAQTVEDVRRLNHYTNLQLLFKEDNQAKGTKHGLH